MNMRSLLSTAVVVWFVMTCTAATADQNQVTIGTGPSTGVYEQIGASICRFLRMRHKDNDLTCRTRGSAGSVENLITLRARSIDLALVQSDLQHHAYNGTSVFARHGADNRLRALFSVVPETFSVVVRGDDDISELSDLLGRNVNIGGPETGQRVVMTSLMEHLGWSATSFESATESTTDFQAADLCNRKIDAAIYVVAHPNMGVRQALSKCDAVLMPVSIPTAEAFFAENPNFFRADISANAYPSIPNPVPSFGVVATILASSDTPSETVYHVVKAVFENLEEMRTLLPVFANLDRSFMLAPHHSAPWHPGAVKYFKEAGLM
jgi:hypothetical protein